MTGDESVAVMMRQCARVMPMRDRVLKSVRSRKMGQKVEEMKPCSTLLALDAALHIRSLPIACRLPAPRLLPICLSNAHAVRSPGVVRTIRTWKVQWWSSAVLHR